MALFPKRQVKKRVGYRTTGLGAGYEHAVQEGVGIEPGAHPEYQRGPRLGNPIRQIGDIWKKLFPRKK
jgi:hypothetical protein